jgi:hypothetical protein
MINMAEDNMSKTVTSVLSAHLNAQDVEPQNAGAQSKQGPNMSDERVYSLANDLPSIPRQLTHYDDDISLVDVALLLIKHKRVLFAVFASIMLLGLSAILFMPKTYDYKAVLEIGSYRLPEQDGVLGKRQEIESITQVKSKLEKRFIPAVWLAYNQQNPDAGFPSVKVSAPTDSNVIELNVTGDQAKTQMYIELLNQVSANLISDHNQKLLDVREQVMQAIEKQRIKVGEYAAELENAKAEQRVLRKRMSEIQQEKTMLTQQLDRTDRNLEKINKLKAQYGAELNSSRDGIALLLLDNQLIETQKIRDSLESLEVVGLSKKAAGYESKLAEIEKSLSMNQLMYTSAKQVLDRYLGVVIPGDAAVTGTQAPVIPADAISVIDPVLNINPTALVVEPYRRAEPASLSNTLMLGILVLTAFFISLIVVFTSDFMHKVKHKARLQMINN